LLLGSGLLPQVLFSYDGQVRKAFPVFQITLLVVSTSVVTLMGNAVMKMAAFSYALPLCTDWHIHTGLSKQLITILTQYRIFK
jgi:hypothetical protein